MKRFGNLYSKICTIENIELAFRKASRGKKHYKAVQETISHLNERLNKIRDMLVNKTYIVKPEHYKKKIIYDRVKFRELSKLDFYPHRIVQWAIMNILEEIFYKIFISSTYASIKKRGIHKLLKDVKKSIFKDPLGCQYCLKLDIKHFYPSIDHDILIDMLHDKFKDSDLLNLLEVTIRSHEEGLPIGSLTSQYLGNFFLSKLDHKIKEVYKIKHYFRYCDDMVILGASKDSLRQYLNLIRNDLKKLNLEVKGNYQIYPTYKRGLDFGGYRFFKDKIIVRKRIYTKARKEFSKGNRNENAICSYLGWFMHADTQRLINKWRKIENEKIYN